MQTDDSVFIITTKKKYAKWVKECVAPILQEERNIEDNEEED